MIPIVKLQVIFVDLLPVLIVFCFLISAEMGDHLRSMVYIVQAYVLLAPHDFLRSCGPGVASTLDDQFSDLQDEGVLLVLRLVDLVTKVGPPETPVIFNSLIKRSYQ